MASTLKHLRSSTANKRPAASGLAEGQFAINTASGTPAVFFKDSNGGVVKVGPAHVGASAPNATPAGSAGNSLGELWVDNSLTTPGLNYYTGSTFFNLTPSGTTTTVGLVELATPAETQTGTDAVRAVTPSGLQSKVSDSTSTTSSTTIASSTAVKSAYDLANAALPKAGGTVTGELLIGNTGSLVFEGSTDDSFETTITVVDPTADRTITFPNITGTVVTTGDSGTVTGTMIANDTIVNADINSAAAIAYSKLALSSGIVNTDISASAAIVDTKLATISTADKVSISALDIDGATDIGGALENGDLFIVDDGAGGTNRKAPAFRMAQLTYSGVTGDITIASGGTSAISAGVIVNADVNASAAIAGTKISPDFGSQTITTTGVVSAALGAAATPSITFTGDLNTGIYSPGADQVAISTNGSARLYIASDGKVGVGTASPSALLEVAGKTIVGSTSSNALEVFSDGDTEIGFSYCTKGNIYAKIIGDITQASPLGGEIAFQTATGGSLFERLRITSAGLVGIGTSSPQSLLSVVKAAEGTALEAIRVVNESANQRSSSSVYIGMYGSNEAYERARILCGNPTDFDGNNGFLSFWTRNAGTLAEKVRIDNAGRLGIGTTSPDANSQLHIVGSSYQPLFVNTTGAGGGGAVFSRSGIQALYVGTAGSSWLSGSSTADGLVRAEANLVFATGGNNQRAQIDSSGRLLVGTSTGVSGTSVQIQGSSASSAGGAVLYMQRGQAAGSITSGDTLGRIYFASNTGGVYAGIEAQTDGAGAESPADYPGRLVFSITADGSASPTEAMRINNAGELLVGYTSDNGAYKLQVNSQIFATSATIATSDGRYKENVTTLDGCVDLVKALRPVSFDWKPQQDITRIDDEGNQVLVREGHNFPDGKQVGFIAQEVQEVLADKPWLGSVIKQNVRPAVKDNDNKELAPEEEFFGIAEGNLVAVLTSALKDAIGRIETLEAEVAALKS